MSPGCGNKANHMIRESGPVPASPKVPGCPRQDCWADPVRGPHWCLSEPQPQTFDHLLPSFPYATASVPRAISPDNSRASSSQKASKRVQSKGENMDFSSAGTTRWHLSPPKPLSEAFQVPKKNLTCGPLVL